MNKNKVSEITRRAMLAALGGITAMTAGMQAVAENKSPAATKRRQTNISKIESDYRRLLSLWQKEREQFSLSSNTYDYWKGPHGKAIIDLGPPIIPYLIQQLHKGDFFFNVPLAVITNVDISNGEMRSEQEMSKLWLKWWDGPSLDTSR